MFIASQTNNLILRGERIDNLTIEFSRGLLNYLRRWVNLSIKEPTEVQKNKKCILVIALNPKILYMRFLTDQLNRKA